MSPPPAETTWDVVIIGGALAGAATATLLLRQNPRLQVLVVEKTSSFARRVGEATVELSAWFLGRTLGLTGYLNESHLVKQGMRFWFFNGACKTLEDCSEIGGRYLSRVPAYQVDRSTLDEEVLRRACGLGARLLRPAAVQRVELSCGGLQTLTVREGDRSRQLSARWVVDASGVAAVLSRQNGWWRPNPAHPTASLWSRWRGVKDWDGLELASQYPKWAAACHGIRGTATNHFVGPGWWAWCIPLKGGDVSIGLVFDQRRIDWPAHDGKAPAGRRLKEFLMQHPVARELLAGAEWIEGDVHWRKNLPYCSSRYAGDGFVLVGDAGAFLDPFYSPGMDWLAFTTTAAADLILAERKGEAIAARIEEHNRAFTRSYDRWFEALYRDKYDYMGDFDLMRLAFMLDLGFYYLGVASQPYQLGLAGLRHSVFTTRLSTPFYHLMRAYNRRLAAIGRARQARGVWGRANAGRRFLLGGYTFSPKSSWPILRALLGWARLEVTEGWRSGRSSWPAGAPGTAEALPAQARASARA